MLKKIAWLLLAAVSARSCAGIQGAHPPLPYRLLLVISDQWKDPASYVIEDGGEFQVLAALMKSWGLPFEILRLDQQRIDKYHLVERDGQPRYGTIIWDAGPGGLQDRGLELVPELVRQQGVGLIVLADAVAAPEISGLAGVRYVSDFISPDNLAATGEHFITRGLNGREKSFLPAGRYWPGNKVAAEDAAVLIRRGPHPFLTVRELGNRGRVAWLGAHRGATQIQVQVVRDLFKRALVWAQGYALYAEYPKSVLLFMDDMGTSDKTFLPYWSYRTPTEEEIRKGLIEPLKRHRAVLMQNVNTGFVDRQSQRVLNPWRQQRVIDAIHPDRVHDFSSTKRGLDAGLREGVFEIQSQGWTHMLPDLDSPPGPWWAAPMDGVGSLGWWTEFGDPVRKKEIPAITQAFHMRRSLEQIQEDFGVTPLFLMRGGGGFSRSYANHTARIAAQLGFGLSELGGDEYLGPDYVINLQPVLRSGGWACDRQVSPGEIPWTVDAPYYLVFHDRDLSLDVGSVERLLSSLGGEVRYMSANEYCAYLHARVERVPEQGLAVAIDYDGHYCRYFATAGSTWTLHLSDELRRTLGAEAPEKQTIRLPKGLGRHVVRAGRRAPG
ncbi:MAG: hypothetical protein FJW34_10745 [Acidobacteria bacterium]|nr:hypothetical protein [Acidobacteriota bacterium]